jgi:carboxymethylenebutenolidase
MASERITLRAPDGGEFSGYLAIPPAGRGPGIVLLQEIFGVTAHIRAVAELYAEEGYVVLAPDLFWRLEPNVEIGDSEGELARAFALWKRFDLERAIGDIGAAIAALRARPECSGKVAALGFCLGGRLAFLAAINCEIDAMVSYYGVGLEDDIAEARAVDCPAVFHFAGEDPYVPQATVARLREAFAGREEIEIDVYPGAGHGFNNPARYHRPAAWMAHSRSLSLLRRAMGPRYDLSALWEKHCEYEFAARDVAATMRTMVASPYVNHIPTMTGGVGHDELARFYKHHFIPKTPKDTKLVPLSRTIGPDRVVDEMLFCFTHDIEIDWMLPGVPPTGRYVEVPLVAIVNFRGDKLYHEHIYWDQASVLVQIGLLDPKGLPVSGAEQARKLLDETRPSNALMAAWRTSEGKPVG